MSKSKHDNTNSLVSLISNTISERNGLSKSKTNLAAKLISMNKQNIKSKRYSKTISSSYMSANHNGETHSVGKEIVNDSTNPYIQVAETHNGDLQYYIIPRNQCKHKSRLRQTRMSTKSTKSKKLTKTRKRKIIN